MNDQPTEHTRHISITRTSSDGTVSQTEVHITAVHHRDAEAGTASADVHIVAEGDCFDPSTCCDAREQALIAAMRACHSAGCSWPLRPVPATLETIAAARTQM